MYNQTTKSYTLGDASTSPYDWLVENMEPADCAGMTNGEIYAWIDQQISIAKDSDIQELKNDEDRVYPRFGYTTAQVFEDEESYITFKTEEINEDYAKEREDVFSWLKEWSSGDKE